MMDIFKQSFIFKICAAVSNAAKLSLFSRLARFIAEQWDKSLCAAVIRRFLSVPDYFQKSGFANFIDKLCSLTERFCNSLILAWKSSFFARLCRFVLRQIKNSRLIAWCYTIGFRRLCIIALALYVLVDFVLRDIVGISFLASGWDEALLVLLLAYVIFQRNASPDIYAHRCTTLGAFIFFFLSVGFFLMCAICPSFSIAFAGYRAVVQYMLWFYVLVRLLSCREDFMLFYYVLTALAVLMCLHGIYQYIIAAPIPSSWVTSTEQGVRTRIFSITGSPNIMGSFIVMTAPLVAGLLYYFKKIKSKIVACCLLAIMCISVLVTFSRGAWGGAVIAVIIFSVLVDWRLIWLMLAGAAAALVSMPSIVSRITFLFTSEYRLASMSGGRMIRWKTGMDLLASGNSFLGFGLGRFGGAVAMQNQVLDTTNGFSYFYMDNYYLKTLVEMGYIGLIAYIILLVAAIVWMLRAIMRLKGNADYPLVCGIFAGLCGVLTHCYFENIFEVPYMNAYFWLLVAMIIFRGLFCRPRNSEILSHGK